MNKEERIAALAKTIRANNRLIKDRVKHIKASLVRLQEIIAAQSLIFECFRNETRSTFTRDLAKVLRLPPGAANKLQQVYRFLVARSKIDRVFLEYSGIIPQAQSKAPQKNTIAEKSPLLTVGTLCGNVRALSERKNLTADEKEIIQKMLEALSQELTNGVK